MTTRTQRDFLKTQLLEVQELKSRVQNHPLMAVSLAEREHELNEKIAALPLGSKEARTILFFSGAPVVGSMGIDASFAGRVIEPFQDMVKADYADRWRGAVGSRGRRKGETESRLLLTGLPHGSFGLELSSAESDDLFQEQQLADTLARVTKLVEASAKSDEDFAAELDEIAPRVIGNLREFLEVVSKNKAGLKMESGDFRCEMDPIKASEAFDRVAGTTTEDKTEWIQGRFRGVTLDTWKFNFLNRENFSIAGKIDEDLTEERVVDLNTKFFNTDCEASISKNSVHFKNGQVRVTYTLKDIRPINQESQTT
jgi:hypothetical protein